MRDRCYLSAQNVLLRHVHYQGLEGGWSVLLNISVFTGIDPLFCNWTPEKDV